MTVPFSDTKLRVPNGFRNILFVFARETMRDNPQDIHEFGRHFFDTLLHIRTHTGHDPAVHGAHSEDRFYNNWSWQTAKMCGEGRRSSQAEEDAATKIQAHFKGYTARKRLSLKDEPEAPCNDNRDASQKKGEESEEIDIDLDDPAVQDAAVMIQAKFKGNMMRKK